jgi:hypothetical protein
MVLGLEHRESNLAHESHQPGLTGESTPRREAAESDGCFVRAWVETITSPGIDYQQPYVPYGCMSERRALARHRSAN